MGVNAGHLCSITIDVLAVSQGVLVWYGVCTMGVYPLVDCPLQVGYTYLLFICTAEECGLLADG